MKKFAIRPLALGALLIPLTALAVDPGRGVGAPGVGVQGPMNRGGPVNRVGPR